MIYNLPPYNPDNVIEGETEYMGWSQLNNTRNRNSFDHMCCYFAKKFPEKSFLRINSNIFPLFSRKHKCDREWCVFRVKDNILYWWDYFPSADIVLYHMRELGDRITQITTLSLPD